MTSSLPTTTRQWIVAQYPELKIDVNKVFKLQEVPILPSNIPDYSSAKNHVLVRTRFLSNDPAQRTWIMDIPDDRHYTKPTRPGSVMPAKTIGVIVFSSHKDFTAGELVTGFWGWQEYVLLNPDELSGFAALQKVPDGIDPVEYMALGLTAWTAYAGLLKVGQATSADKTIVVSGAAGATGSTVIQLAKKVLGCKRVIGFAGSEEKCKLVREVCGADICLNYKSPTFEQDFIEATPEYVDVFFDNTGTNLDMILSRAAKYARVVSCGAIGNYDGDQKKGVMKASSYSQIVMQEIQLKGFIIISYFNIVQEITENLAKWTKEGGLTPLKTAWETTFDQVPQGIPKLLRGDNIGKLVTVLP